jgi:hypothetical protein
VTISSVSGSTALTYTPPDAPPPVDSDDDPIAAITQAPADGVAAGKGPGGHHGHHHHGGGGGGVDALGEAGDTTGKLQDLSDALGTDPDTLLSQLMDGDSSGVDDASSTPYSSASELPTSGLAVDYRA